MTVRRATKSNENLKMENGKLDSIGAAFLESAIKRFAEYKALGDKTIAQLADEQLHLQPNPASNSIAIIIQHLHGNMRSRWTNFLTEDGEKPWRERDAEFEPQALSRDALLQRWNEGWSILFQNLERLTEHDLLKNITIRTQPLVVIDAINRQLAHSSYHVGQIVFLGKWLQGGAWQSLSIPKGASQQFNETLRKKQ
jgi:hypothetical protein